MAPAEVYEAKIAAPVPETGAGQVLYAAAFIDPAVRAVAIRDNGWVFQLSAPVAEARLAEGLATLIQRFDGVDTSDSAPAFALPLPSGAATKLPEIWARAARQVHPGLFVFRAPLSTLLRFLDAAVLDRFARPFEAREESYPNCIPLDSLGRAEHLSSFPEHLHFLTHLREDLTLLDDYASRVKVDRAGAVPDSVEVSRAELVQNPSTCYHCYAALRGEEITANLAVTAITKCHRFEAANHVELGRLLEFSLREVIFLGDPDFVRETRARTLSLVEALAQDWQLYGELIPSNDPFFTSDFEAKAAHQRRLALKFEYRMAVPGQDRKLAVMSSNLHGPTFSKAFDIKRNGRVINTGCLGFGLERLALAIVAQHGADPAGWPDRLAQDFQNWRSTDPLNR
ncbi:MAG: hypothetical protein QNJ94_04240 [Alphaproteobacteria bacterium]|nr:hypothetical protein [Alphaproteobacteria bacterium]